MKFGVTIESGVCGVGGGGGGADFDIDVAEM